MSFVLDDLFLVSIILRILINVCRSQLREEFESLIISTEFLIIFLHMRVLLFRKHVVNHWLQSGKIVMLEDWGLRASARIHKHILAQSSNRSVLTAIRREWKR